MSEQEMRTGEAGVEHEGSGSIEGVTRGEAGTFNASTGGRAARAHRSLGRGDTYYQRYHTKDETSETDGTPGTNHFLGEP